MRMGIFGGNSSLWKVMPMLEDKTLGQEVFSPKGRTRRQAIALLILEMAEGRKVAREIDPQIRQLADEIWSEIEHLDDSEKMNYLFDLLLLETEASAGGVEF